MLVVLLAAVGCAGPKAASRGAGVVYLSDSASITAIEAVPPLTYVGTTLGLEVRDARTGEVTRLASPEGLPGDRVQALSVTPNGELWIAADEGLARYDAVTGLLSAMTPPPELEAEALGGFTAVAADDMGAWLGTRAGLWRVERDGAWQPTAVREPVGAVGLVDGELWVTTAKAAHHWGPDGKFVRFGPGEGFDLGEATSIAGGPDGSVVFAGHSGGQGRIAVVWDGEMSTFRLSPVEQPVDMVSTPRGLFVLTRGRLYALKVPRIGERVVTDRVFLVSEAGELRQSPLELQLVDLSMPPGATTLAASEGAILVGTRSLGMAVVLAETSGWTARWSRSSDLMEGALDLTVACEDSRHCWLATGSERAWFYDGSSLSPFSPEQNPGMNTETFAVVRAPDGGIYALYRSAGHQGVTIARRRGHVFEPLQGVELQAPGGVSGISFARFAPDGLLWVGLQVGEADEATAYGVAVVDLTLSSVFFHRESARKSAGIMPVPNDATDVSFRGDEIWFATLAGVARIEAGQVKVYSEADGLETELFHAVVATAGGFVFAATSRGVAVFDGQSWQFPDVLDVEARSIAQDGSGRLWIGTPTGLLVYDGQSVTEKAPRLGLVGGHVDDVATDHLGRVWARSSEGIAIVTP